MDGPTIDRLTERYLLEIRVGITVGILGIIALEHLIVHQVEDLMPLFGVLDPPEVNRIREQVLDADLLIIPCDILRPRAGLSGDLLGTLHPIRIILFHGLLTLICLQFLLGISLEIPETIHKIHLYTTHTPTMARTPRTTYPSILVSMPNPPRSLKIVLRS